MGFVLTTTAVHSGPGGTNVYAQIGALFALDGYTKIWDEYGYQYVEYPVTDGVKRGYIPGGANVAPNEFGLGGQGKMRTNQTVWSTPNGDKVSLGSVDAYESISVLIPNSNSYAFVEYGSATGTKRGWVLKSAVQLDGETALAKMSNHANTYVGPNAYDVVIGSLAEQEYVTILEENDEVAYVEYCITTSPYRKRAYIHNDSYTRLNIGANVPDVVVYDDDDGVLATMLDGTQVYAGPDQVAYAQIGSVNHSESVKVVFSEFDWFCISYGTSDGSKRGYVPKENVSNANAIDCNVADKTGLWRGYAVQMEQQTTAYTGPNQAFAEAGVVGENEPVTVLDESNSLFSLVEYTTSWGAKRGYVLKSKLNEAHKGCLAYLNHTSTNVYFDEQCMKMMGAIGLHEYFVLLASYTIEAENSNVYFVEYNTNAGKKRGFVKEFNVVKLGANAVQQYLLQDMEPKRTTLAVTVYGGPGDKYAEVGAVSLGEPVYEVASEQEYSMIQYTAGTENKRGYVLTQLLNDDAFAINGLSGIAIPEQYGESGCGRPLIAYKLGTGANHLILNFAIHGWEDIWNASGQFIERVGEATVRHLHEMLDVVNEKNWTVYTILASNPDGLIEGKTHDGQGRCTMKRYGESRGELVDGGVDMNRSFAYKDANGNTAFDIQLNNPRYYTGPEPNWCKESEALKNFLDTNVAVNGVTVFIDTHGYTQQIITSATTPNPENPDHSLLYTIFQAQFTDYGHEYNNSSGYVAKYAHDFCGMESCLFEFPTVNSEATLYNRGAVTSYLAAIGNIITDFPTT